MPFHSSTSHKELASAVGKYIRWTGIIEEVKRIKNKLKFA